ncbi:MAG: ferrous iron transport protein B [Gemmatales bacterium]
MTALPTPLPANTAKRHLTVALVGNPNTGKTTLFNALCGMHQRVGNYPGVTVEKKVGTCTIGHATISFIDLPGTYSLAARSPDELVSVDLLLGHQAGEPKPDLILNIVDASNLERHLFLTTQLVDLGIPIIVAANMMDHARDLGIAVDFDQIRTNLGLTIIPIEAHRKIGLDDLRSAIIAQPGSQPRTSPFPEPFQNEVSKLDAFLEEHQVSVEDRHASLLSRLLIDRQGAVEQRYVDRLPGVLPAYLEAARSRLDGAGCSVPQMEARHRYGFLRQAVRNAIVKENRPRNDLSSRIDRIVTHRVWGLVIFLTILFVIFQSIFVGAEPLKEMLDQGIKKLGVWSTSWLSAGPFKSLINDGIFAGVGGIIAFLPQILILFGFMAILEDCGYMARAAFLMDKIMSRCGLSGKSFIPMLSSFACAIPGVMATRVIEDRRDRLATMLVAPLMSCSARLPVYALLIGAFVPLTTMLGGWLPGLVLFGLYMIGIIVAPLVALVLKRTVLRGKRRSLFWSCLPIAGLRSIRCCIACWSGVGRSSAGRARSSWPA